MGSGGPYVFFHVGESIEQPTMLVKSILRVDPGAEIIHCSDTETPSVPAVTRRFELQGDRTRLMSFRLRAFSALALDRPAIHIDTDMLLLKRVLPGMLLAGRKGLFCRRFFNRDGAFNGRFGGMDFMEYDRLPLDTVYPVLACATVTPDARVWETLTSILEGLHPKFSVWYGDQEAMKKLIASAPKEEFGFLSEAEFGCLPEQDGHARHATLLHFKGAQRKAVMTGFFSRLTASPQFT